VTANKTLAESVTPIGRRSIAIFTGNRAEYGQLFPIIRAIAKHPSLDHYLIVSGAHLDPDFGETLSEIKNDGFEVFREVGIKLQQDTLSATAQAIGTGITEIGTALDELKPDIFLVSADRYEGFAAMVAGTQMNIPTAHIEGGDITEGGALDDSVRHAMSKLAHLHFTSNEDSRNRVLGLGEEPWRVWNVGLAMLDLVAEGNFASPDEVVARLGLDRNRPVVVFTQHSVTTEFEQALSQIQPSLRALERLASTNCQIVITYPNNDAGGRHILAEIEGFCRRKVDGIQVHPNLGRYYYHGLLNLCGRVGIGACVGNSSSGIKETPAFGCPAVNIGSRERNRLRGENVIDVQYEEDEIFDATMRSLHDEVWRKQCAGANNPYGAGDSGSKIAEVLATISLDVGLVQKKMTY